MVMYVYYVRMYVYTVYFIFTYLYSHKILYYIY